MKVVRPINVAGMDEQVVKGDKSLQVIGLRIRSSQNGYGTDTGLKWAVEGGGLAVVP